MKSPLHLLLLFALPLAACQPSTLAPPESTPIPTASVLTLASTQPSANPPGPGAKAILFDDDGSPDGTAALFYLLSDPMASIAGISVSYGEAYPDTYIQHLGRKLDELGIQDIPLGAGRAAPLAGDNAFPEALRQAANDYWGLRRPNADKNYPASDAATMMVSILSHATDPMTVFISGPCTNLAQALRLDPGIRDHIAAVYIMGGAVYVPGNISDLEPHTDNTVSEWNIYADPQAAQEVFESGLDLYLVPLDATNLVSVTLDDVAAWRHGGPSADAAAEIYDLLLTSWGVEQAAIWDVMTAAIMIRPGLCGFQDLPLEVTAQGGPTSGQTRVLAQGPPNIHVCLQPDAGRITQTLRDVFSRSK